MLSVCFGAVRTPLTTYNKLVITGLTTFPSTNMKHCNTLYTTELQGKKSPLLSLYLDSRSKTRSPLSSFLYTCILYEDILVYYIMLKHKGKVYRIYLTVYRQVPSV